MITNLKTFETIREDLQLEESRTIAFFEKITSLLFKGVLILGIPLLTYMLLFL